MMSQTNRSDYHPLIKGSSTSETSFWINLAGLLIGVGSLEVCHCFCKVCGPLLFIVFALATTLSIILFERLFFPRTCFYSRWKIRRKISWRRVFYKEVAFLVTMVVIGFFYWLLPLFEISGFTDEYKPFLSYLVPFLFIASLPYFCLMDRIDETPNDIYFKIGRAIVRRKKAVTRFELGNYVRSWLVKAFYLSLMQPAMMGKIDWLLQPSSWENITDSPASLFYAASAACFFIDLAYASVGYLVNFKILNSQTRTAEPTLLGWTVAVMCYFPFWGALFYPYFFCYDEIGWMTVFRTGSVLWWIWFALIIGTELIYGLASVAIGFRFSNLTYRGLVNTGPYRWTKHPAYVFKNISWWLLSMPFMAASPVMAVKLSLLLFLNNVVYYLRARTEERHLSHYPEYVAYALEMNDKSIFRWAAKIVPFLKYRPLKQSERLF